MTTSIEIRDLRQQDWLWTSKDILFHEAIDGNNYKVYCGLAAYANNNSQQAFPSIDTLAGRLHMSRNTVIAGLGKLEKNSFIKIEKKLGEHNIYYLLDTQPPKEKKIIQGVEQLTQPEKPAENKTTCAHWDAFWNTYPNKANKKVSETKFEKLKCHIHEALILDVARRKKYHSQWLKGFIPHASTYINQERWKDPIVAEDGTKPRDIPIIHPDIKKRLFQSGNAEKHEEATREPGVAKSMKELIHHE